MDCNLKSTVPMVRILVGTLKSSSALKETEALKWSISLSLRVYGHGHPFNEWPNGTRRPFGSLNDWRQSWCLPRLV